jgi:hypothetical protein
MPPLFRSKGRPRLDESRVDEILRVYSDETRGLVRFCFLSVRDPYRFREGFKRIGCQMILSQAKGRTTPVMSTNSLFLFLVCWFLQAPSSVIERRGRGNRIGA